jgi:hypothetical protein
MANMSHHGQANGIFIKSLRRSRPTDSAAVFGARVFRYGSCGLWRAFRIELPNRLSKMLDVCEVQFSPAVRLMDAAPCPCIFVRQALGFSLPESWFLDQ